MQSADVDQGLGVPPERFCVALLNEMLYGVDAVFGKLAEAGQ